VQRKFLAGLGWKIFYKEPDKSISRIFPIILSRGALLHAKRLAGFGLLIYMIENIP
jgi:hypothetical protein